MHDLLSKLDEKDNDKYITMINHYVGLTLRSEYDKIPKKMLVPTFIYNRITLSKDIMLQHNLKDEKTKYIKNIQSENEAILAHCTTNMDKYEADKEIINNSKKGMVKSHYIANENFDLFIYSEVKDEILDKIRSFVKGQSGGNNYYHKYVKYKSKYLRLVNE